MAKKRGRNKAGREDRVEDSVKTEISLGEGIRHFEEPLLIISILTCITVIIRPLIGGDWMAQGLVGLLFLSALVSIYITYLYFSGEKRNYYFLGTPLLIVITAIFSWQASGSSAFTARDYTVFSIMFGILSLFYALALHKIIKLRHAVILTLFLSTLIIHLAPAFTPSYSPLSGRYLAALDPYFYYRHANTVVETGYAPEHETLTYPTDSPNHAWSPLMASVLMGSLATILIESGLGLHDVAMLYPGVFSAFTVILFYLLLRDLFEDMKPYNYAVALLGAFMLMLNHSFAAKAIATNCEDDALGMFLIVSSFLLFVISFRRKSLIIAILAGFSFLLLRISWAGYMYAITVFGVFGFLYAVINFIHKRNCVEHIPYFVIPMLMTQLHPLILHARGILPGFVMPSQTFLLPFGGVLIVSFFLEVIRGYRAGETRVKGKAGEIGNQLDDLIHRYANHIGAILLLLTAYYLFIISNPANIMDYAVGLITGAKQRGIIGMTTAEQNALCSSFDSSCLNNLMTHFGLAILFGLGMVPLLLYFMLVKRSLGATFVLTWSLPMIYGVAQKSQYQFTASVPIVALGSTICLVIAMKWRDIQGLRVVPTIILVFTPLLFFLYQGGVPYLDGPFGGTTIMHMGAGRDRIYWEDTLRWLGEQPDSIRVLTWWDYGHWIAAVSKRTSILDNTKNNGFMVQDIAKFHVVVENETEALEIARKYGATHVVIDYTMIGKSGAPHFIATSGLGGYIPFKATGVEIECINGHGCVNLIEGVGEDCAYTYIDQNGSIVIDLSGEYVINKTEMHLWDLDNRQYRYQIEVSGDGVKWRRVVDKTEGEWSGLQIDSFDDVRARLVRITGTYSSTGNEFRVASVKIYNPRYEGSSMGYSHCEFSPGSSVIEPMVVQNDEGGFDRISELRFMCNLGLGENKRLGLNFRIKNHGGEFNPKTDISGINVEIWVWIPEEGRWVVASSLPWEAWRSDRGASILGVQPPGDILYGALHDPELKGNSIFKFDTFRTLVYVPKFGEYDFNKVMMTKLYLGDYLEEYQALGLADPTIEKPKYFKLVNQFSGNIRTHEGDKSSWGYVRVYDIIYPEEGVNTSSTESGPES